MGYINNNTCSMSQDIGSKFSLFFSIFKNKLIAIIVGIRKLCHNLIEGKHFKRRLKFLYKSIFLELKYCVHFRNLGTIISILYHSGVFHIFFFKTFRNIWEHSRKFQHIYIYLKILNTYKTACEFIQSKLG